MSDRTFGMSLPDVLQIGGSFYMFSSAGQGRSSMRDIYYEAG
jgi:hypothetical protein